MLIKTEFSSFKTVEGVRSLSLKMFILGEPFKVCRQGWYAKSYMQKYNATNVIIYACYGVTIYGYYNAYTNANM